MKCRVLAFNTLVGGMAFLAINGRAQGLEVAAANHPVPTGAVDQIAPLGQRATTSSIVSNFKATSIIGMTVRGESGERLGKVQDLIVSMDSRTAPFAIVEYGGALGVGVTRVAVPLASLKWSRDAKQVSLAATKSQFEAGSAGPTTAWVIAAGDDWMKNIDRFYGQPAAVNGSPSEPRSITGQGVREAEPKAPNGEPEQPKGDPELKHQVVTPTDEFVMGRINGLVRQALGDGSGDVQITLKDGVVTLGGRVASIAQKKLVESQIKTLGGVNRVQNNLSVANY